MSSGSLLRELPIRLRDVRLVRRQSVFGTRLIWLCDRSSDFKELMAPTS